MVSDKESFEYAMINVVLPPHTNSPRSLSNHIRKCQKCREELGKALRSQLIEGMTLFIVFDRIKPICI